MSHHGPGGLHSEVEETPTDPLGLVRIARQKLVCSAFKINRISQGPMRRAKVPLLAVSTELNLGRSLMVWIMGVVASSLSGRCPIGDRVVMNHGASTRGLEKALLDET